MNDDLPSLTNRRPKKCHRHDQFFIGAGFLPHTLNDGPISVSWQSDIVPAQLQPNPKWDPQQRLCFAIIQDAIEVYWKGKQFPSTRIQRLAREAEQWIRANDEDWVFSFVCICEALGWDVDRMRAGVLGEKRRAA